MKKKPQEAKEEEPQTQSSLPTFIEVQADISRKMNTDLPEGAGILSAWQHIKSREGLIRQALQHMIGGRLLELTAKNGAAGLGTTLPSIRKMRELLKDPHAPEQVDMAYLHAVKSHLGTIAYQQYQQEGRGALVLDLTRASESSTDPTWLSQAALKQHTSQEGWLKPAGKQIAEYDPMNECVVVILRPASDSRVYRVTVHG